MRSTTVPTVHRGWPLEVLCCNHVLPKTYLCTDLFCLFGVNGLFGGWKCFVVRSLFWCCEKVHSEQCQQSTGNGHSKSSIASTFSRDKCTHVSTVLMCIRWCRWPTLEACNGEKGSPCLQDRQALEKSLCVAFPEDQLYNALENRLYSIP